MTSDVLSRSGFSSSSRLLFSSPLTLFLTFTSIPICEMRVHFKASNSFTVQLERTSTQAELKGESSDAESRSRRMMMMRKDAAASETVSVFSG